MNIHAKNFISWYNNEFKNTRLYQDMKNTKEDSPWHREDSVAAHTDMVVMSLLAQQDHLNGYFDSGREYINTLFAAAFHDVGKPSVRTEKHSEERGTYYSFAEHELRSARLWQDFYITNIDMFVKTFDLQPQDFYVITMMIEKHRPWGIKDKKKIDGIYESLGVEQSLEFLKLLVADNSGRETDDVMAFENSLEKVVELGKHLRNYEVNDFYNAQRRLNELSRLNEYGKTGTAVPQLIMPIAPAGSGKSTLFNRIRNLDTVVNPTEALVHQHSMDLIRRERYGPDDNIAFRMSCEDKEFNRAVQADFIQHIKQGNSVYVDNTNLSAKRRRFYITEARKHGYNTHALLIPLSLREAIDRNAARKDKKLGVDVVIRQYMALSMPILGQEFDLITFV